jgi:hypothetical protein
VCGCVFRHNTFVVLVFMFVALFRHYYRRLAKSAGKDFRDGAVVLFE